MFSNSVQVFIAKKLLSKRERESENFVAVVVVNFIVQARQTFLCRQESEEKKRKVNLVENECH